MMKFNFTSLFSQGERSKASVIMMSYLCSALNAGRDKRILVNRLSFKSNKVKIRTS